ncbi:putative UPF0481 protein At3g02645 [Alnus glutinosa]|uniref:putative UPF0481 protein At3g02645 n=1 Tax=Alnus glutinosa TaxID=3517 RepID=UPI002D776099|nr:putative UPF0481 protein At3g02645 [Alnus glutinosa]
MAHLIDYTRKTEHHAILRDIIMLENQIPLFLLRDIHSFYLLHENHDQALATMLMGFCKDLSPIKYINYQHFREECFERAHLLELLYHMVAPKLQLVPDCEQEEPKADEEIGWFRKALKSFLAALIYINLAVLRLLSKICKSKVIKFLVTLPFTVLSYVLHLGNKGDINNLISSAEGVAEEVESASQKTKEELRPLVEEIAIPSVQQLHKVGVKFRPAKGGLESINFDKCCGKFYLPVIHLDDNSEVVLRNLVAYEACIAPEVMVFTRYTELMNGIIDSEEDVRILREAGIILNRLKSDEEVATLWNGMTKSVRVTKVPILDKAIEDMGEKFEESKDLMTFISDEELNDEEENVVLPVVLKDDEKVEEPKASMTFSSIEEVCSYYKKYAKQAGFGLAHRSSRKKKGIKGYVVLICTRGGTE